jgi:outer membrane murein-binding lipoprotein Lpp
LSCPLFLPSFYYTMEPQKAPAPTINLAQILNGVLTALLLAAIGGLFSMNSKMTLLEERNNTLRTDYDKLELRCDKLRDDQNAFRETANQRFNSIDELKESFDKLTRTAQPAR